MSSRDAFIAQLIAALRETDGFSTHGQSHSGSSSTDETPTEQLFSFAPSHLPSTATTPHAASSALARRAYDALQFDYPLVDDDALRALADVYRSITEQPTLESARAFPLTTAMVEAIAFLNDSMDKRRGTEASGLLAAALLVLVPRFCVAHPLDPVSAVLLQELRVQVSPVPAKTPPPATETKTLLDQFKHENSVPDKSEHAELQFSGGFVEIYAAEEDPDDLSLVYEGSTPTAAQQPWHSVAPPPSPPSAPLCSVAATSMSHTAQLQYLASKTYSTCFSLVSSTLWVDWKLHDALQELIQELLFHPLDSPDHEREQERTGSLYGEHGEWLRYLFVLRDQLLRFADHSDACASGLRTLKSLIEKSSTTQVAPPCSSDPFFISPSSSKTKPTTTLATPPTSAEEQLRRMALRVLAELAVSKEFNATQSRRSQHALALTIQQLFPVVFRELTRLAPLVTGSSSSSSSSSAEEDVVLVLLQLLHFVVVAADSTATSLQLAIDKLHDSGLLRAWLAFLPPPPPPSADGNTTATTATREWPWLAPLLRLFGESALWNHEFASYVSRVSKLTLLLNQTPSQTQRLSSESLLLEIAFAQHDLLLGGGHWTERLASEQIFPSACGSYIESMHKMGDAVFLLDVLAKAVSSLRPSVAEQLRRSLQSIYSTRFSTAFQYPTFAVPEDEVAESLLKEEPEPPPQNGTSKAEEIENRGRAEALQFVALRNRLRQCAKSILLSQFTGSGVSSFSSSSSKLD